jgi:glycosyltransferase involved in cell wall biosynthesis
MVKVSIIIPTKNNVNMLEKCLKSIQCLDFPKDEYEVIIVDGYSTDGTVEIAKKYGCKVIFEDKGTISYARDLGLKYSKGEFIAFTDADCIVDKNWLNELLKEFRDENVAAVGGPNITPEDDTEFAKCVGDILSFLSKVGARYGVEEGVVREIYHNPTCNVMYRKSIPEKVGGFNHSLITVDDEELDYRIRRKGYRILYTPHAIVYHYRRRTWRSFAKMAYNYGLGRGQAIKLHRDLGKWFHFIPSITILLIIMLLILSFLNNTFLFVTFLILLLGTLGIATISFHLSRKRKRSFLKYFGLIVMWLCGYGLGMLRGLIR